LGSYNCGRAALIKGGFMEIGEVLEKVEVEFKRWHFEQVKNYVNVLDVTY
jgi:hypothetical protein